MFNVGLARNDNLKVTSSKTDFVMIDCLGIRPGLRPGRARMLVYVCFARNAWIIDCRLTRACAHRKQIHGVLQTSWFFVYSLDAQTNKYHKPCVRLYVRVIADMRPKAQSIHKENVVSARTQALRCGCTIFDVCLSTSISQHKTIVCPYSASEFYKRWTSIFGVYGRRYFVFALEQIVCKRFGCKLALWS